MIDMRYKPSWLPQMSAPFGVVTDMLEKEGIGLKLVKVNPKKLKPSQGIIFAEKVSEMNPKALKPIWISEDGYVLDGHHRYGSALSHELPTLKAIQIQLPAKDAARLLNKIQDIYDYESQRKMEEVVAQDQINAMQEPDFLEELQKDIAETKAAKHKKKKMKGYRQSELKENSKVGNFFSPKKIDGYKEYEMEFNNILDTDDIGVILHPDSSPANSLAKSWFPNIEFDKVAKKYNVRPDSIMNRAVSEKARKLGYDGIKYGDVLIQGF
jgi:hypothetical protein